VPTLTPYPTPRPPHDAPPVRVTTPPFAAPSPHAIPAMPDMLWLAQGDAIAVPIMEIDGRAFVQVLLNGHPTQFLLDSLASQTEVDARAPDLSPSPQQLLQIGELRVLHAAVVRSNVRSYTATNFGVAADGIIGGDLFARYPVGIDYGSSTLTIYRSSQAAAVTRGPQTVSVPLLMVGSLPAAAVTLNGESAGLFAIDTASGFDLVVRPGVLGSKHLHMTNVVPELREPEPGAHNGRTARADSVAIGPMRIEQPLVALPNERPRAEPEMIAGMLGADLMQHARVLIDVPGQSLSLTPLLTAAPSNYDRSGLWLVDHSGRIFVHSVLAGSPAALAGLRPGDEIVRIDGAAQFDLESLRRALMQPVGTRVPLTYQRARQTATVTLVLRNLL